MLEIVNVDIQLGPPGPTLSVDWLDVLEKSLPDETERVIFLPPLVANVMCLPSSLRNVPLRRATLTMLPLRPLRFASVFFAYPGIGRERLPWAVMHDRMERFIREDLGRLARETGSTVITSVLADHPRMHWEAWPERGDLYHSIQTIGPDGDPIAALRQRRPQTTFGSTLDIDPEDSNPGSHVWAQERPVGIVWDGDSLSRPSFEQPTNIVWCPRPSPRAPMVEPVSILRGSERTEVVITTTGCRDRNAGSIVHKRPEGGLQAMACSQALCNGLRVGRLQINL